MTDEQVAKINELVKNCKHKTSGVCALQVLPCERVIDTGRCPMIIDYLSGPQSYLSLIKLDKPIVDLEKGKHHY